jgi:hypothetical protein
MNLNRLRKARFDALCYSRNPIFDIAANVTEWWADAQEKVLGIVLLDLTDHDWSIVILGRDEVGMFRAIAVDVCFTTQGEASTHLQRRMLEFVATGATDFPQNDVTRKKLEILQPEVPVEKTHRNFKILLNDVGHSAAREILKELAYAFIDVDGNYVRDFQTTGFNSRLWELYLFAFLYEQRFSIFKAFKPPDYCAAKNGFPIALEAVTVNATDGENSPRPDTESELVKLRQDYMPIKFGSALFSKLNKRYWELPQVTGRPFLLAIHDYHGNDSMTWSSPALGDYLFGLRASWVKDADGILHVTETPIYEHVWGDKRVPSGFFNLAEAKFVSAVLFSNSATLAKFNRMGKLAGFGDDSVTMIRVGDRHDFTPHSTKPIRFYAEVDPDKYAENWSEGMQVFHNPNALFPLGLQIFEGCAQHFIEQGKRTSYLPESFVHSSNTLLFIRHGGNPFVRKQDQDIF